MLEVTYYQPRRIWICIIVSALFVMMSVVHGYSSTAQPPATAPVAQPLR